MRTVGCANFLDRMVLTGLVGQKFSRMRTTAYGRTVNRNLIEGQDAEYGTQLTSRSLTTRPNITFAY